MAQNRKKRSSVWEYFEKCDFEINKAKCLICHKIFNCSTSHNLKHHLRYKHSDVVEDSNFTSTPKAERISPKSVPDRRTSELVGKAFTKVEGDKLAMCNLCLRIFSFRSTIANLKVHLKRVHRDEYQKLFEGVKYDSDSEDNNISYHSNEDEEFSNSNDESDSGQLKDEHVKYPKLEVIDDDVYTEVVYLEEDAYQIKKKNSGKQTAQQKKMLPGTENFTGAKQFSRNEKAGRNSGNNELDQFGQYIATLLASLPKHVCTKLQMNILKQIMDEKLSMESEKERSENRVRGYKVHNNEEMDDNDQ